MKSINEIQGVFHAAMNGQVVEIGKEKLVWCKAAANGTSFPVAKVYDKTDGDESLPWYDIYVEDYEGVRYDMAEIEPESADELLGEIINFLY